MTWLVKATKIATKIFPKYFCLDSNFLSVVQENMSRNSVGREMGDSMIVEALERLADRVLDYDESELTALLKHFKTRMEQCETSPEWERAVIAYFLINGVRVKNALKHGRTRGWKRNPGSPPALRLVK